MDEIRIADVEYVADLAHLALDDDAKERMRADMASILGYIEKLRELDTDAIEPMMHVVEITNRFRDDIVAPSLSRDDALKNAPDTNGEHFLVPRILDAD